MKLATLSFEEVLPKENIKKSMETKCFIWTYEKGNCQEEVKNAN